MKWIAFSVCARPYDGGLFAGGLFDAVPGQKILREGGRPSADTWRVPIQSQSTTGRRVPVHRRICDVMALLAGRLVGRSVAGDRAVDGTG